MDEPTAALAGHEAEELLALVGRLRAAGLGILYISHRLREVFAVADRITVLKDGRRVDTRPAADTNAGELVTRMVGRELSAYTPPRATPDELGPVRLAVRGGANARLADIDLEVRAGEVVGVAGLQGAGRTELARAVFGADPFTSGTVEVDGQVIHTRRPRQGIAAGIGFITEDRKDEGLALGQSVRDNTLLALRSGAAPERARAGLVERLARSTELRARSLEQEVRYLSGGNQQKVVLAKWLALEPRRDALRRADPGRRRGRQGRHPRADAGAGPVGHRRRDDQLRAARADRHERPHRRDARGPRGRRAAGRGQRAAGHRPRRRPGRAGGGVVNAVASVRRTVGGAQPIWGALAIIVVVGWVVVSLDGGTFLTTGNTTDILQRSVALGTVAVGQTIAIVAGSLDLSVAQLISLSSLVAAGTMDGEASMLVPGIAVTLLLGAGVGLANGLIVTKLRVNPFIATLGMALLLRGYIEANYDGPSGSVPDSFESFGYTRMGPIPVSVFLFAGVALVAGLALRRTAWGYHVYAVGGDERGRPSPACGPTG